MLPLREHTEGAYASVFFEVVFFAEVFLVVVFFGVSSVFLGLPHLRLGAVSVTAAASAFVAFFSEVFLAALFFGFTDAAMAAESAFTLS
jgi:hypothetical protein